VVGGARSPVTVLPAPVTAAFRPVLGPAAASPIAHHTAPPAATGHAAATRTRRAATIEFCRVRASRDVRRAFLLPPFPPELP
jgi:hypothetical protein